MATAPAPPSRFNPSMAALAAALLCVHNAAHGQTSHTQHKPSVAPAIVKKLPMPMTAPLFLEGATYTSTLYVVNQLNFGVQADIMVYDMSGALLTTGHRYMEPNSQQSLSVKKLLSDGGLYAEVGSIEVVSPENSTALLGQLSVTRTGPHPAYLDQELFMPAATGSQTLKAVIDTPENSPIVAVTNVSSTTAQILHVNCIPSSGSAVTKSVNLQPKQTRLVRACSLAGDQAYSPDAVDSQFVLAPESATGMAGQRVAGISITGDGPGGEIAAFGFVEHADTYGNYFSAMNFADPALLNSTATVFAGVPAGPTGHGLAYTPQVALTNFSETPQTASISFATTAAGLSDSNQVAQVTLPPHSSQFINIPKATGSPQWENSFIVRSSGQPGDVLSKMMFKTVGPLPNIELIGKDEQDMHNAGDHPWTIENGTRSTLYLFNHGQTTRKVTIRIGSGADVWLKMYDLYPSETKALAIGDLIQRQTPDDKGYVFPRSTTHGEVSWWAPKPNAPEVSGRVVQADAQGTMARNFSCGSEMGICSIEPFYYENSFEVSTDDVYNMPATPAICIYNLPMEGGGGGSACPASGQTTNQSTYLQWKWNVQNPNIAEITSGSNTATAVWQGMSPGTTPFSVVAMVNESNFCTSDGNMTDTPSVTISGPTTMALVGKITLTATGLPTGQPPDGTYSWASNSNILNVQSTSNPNIVNITATAAGSATVTVTYTVNGAQATASQQITVQACPTTLVRTKSSLLPLTPYVPATYLTGIGIVANMQVGPSTIDWDLTAIKESITITANSCPAGFPTAIAAGTFYVGADDNNNDQMDGVPTPATQNVFYDNHTSIASTNVLANYNISSCSQSFSQVYTCQGNQVGSPFNVTYSYTLGTVNSTSVTNVNVSKTP